MFRALIPGFRFGYGKVMLWGNEIMPERVPATKPNVSDPGNYL